MPTTNPNGDSNVISTNDQGDALGDIAGDAIAAMPPVDTDGIAAIAAAKLESDSPGVDGADSNAAAPSMSGTTANTINAASESLRGMWTDAVGTPFDPDIHYLDNGIPKKTPTGKFRIKRGTGGVAKGNNNQTVTKAGPTGVVMSADALRAACTSNGKASAQLLTTIGSILFGEEWNPKPGELESLSTAFTEYYIATGCPNMPPWLGLSIAVGGYAVPRFFMPGTQERIKWAITKVKGVAGGK
jgi:hypothetical protein